MNDEIEIHRVTDEESPALIDWFSVNYYDDRQDAEDHFLEHIDGKSATFLARHDDEMVGYVTLGISWLKKIPLITNIMVFEPYQKQGLGNRLMEVAESYTADNLGDQVVLWVPILSEFGPAQRMYVKRGYIPDGCGVVKDGVSVKFGETHTFDHSLHLCLVKQLSTDIQ